MALRQTVISILAATCLAMTSACREAPPASPPPAEATEPEVAIHDPHSFARPDQVRVRHLSLDLDVDFEQRQLSGSATLELDNPGGATELVLDTRDLTIHSAWAGDAELSFELGDEQPFLGRALTIPIDPDTASVRIDYSTSPHAEALQWLESGQTAGGVQPFLFSQSQAILARTWVPCQDTPGVRMTYDATVRVPPGLLAVMSAENPTEVDPEGTYRFEMAQPIPSYLLALAVGELEFRSMGDRSGVYAEPSVVEKAAWEFADVEPMMDAAERLYGPYRWERYDLLVLPPSFPFGGMENPRLTFATPTILAGDRSLVSLVAHELAHSWSGNLVTNATWNDFWLNEGFTSYIENRLMEELYGREYAEMIAALGRQDLEGTLDSMGAGARDSHLHLDLAGRNPDDGMTNIAYEKGAAFLATLEQAAGRERWDAFLKKYFDAFAFRSTDTGTFESFLDRELLAADPQLAAAAQADKWIYGPGLPDNAAPARSDAFSRVDAQVAAFSAGTPAGRLDTDGWTTHHWLHMIRHLPTDLASEQMTDLDQTFGFGTSGNSEVLCAWLTASIQRNYLSAYPALEKFLLDVGRRKFLRPLYAELANTPAGKRWARKVYRQARPRYHAISTGTIDQILDWES